MSIENREGILLVSNIIVHLIVIKESEVIEYMGFNGESRFLYNRLRCQFFLTSGLFTGCAIINVIRANVTFTSLI